MSNLIKLPGVRDLPRSRKAGASRMDTIILTRAGVKAWKAPPFQRPLRVNEKVRALAETLKANGGVVPGVLTLGELGRETYLLDGQHRIESLLLSELAEGIADVRICSFEDLGEMGEEFVDLNSRLVNMRPDDVLRGLENSLQPLAELRKRCPFIGYDQIRRGTRAPLLSMSTSLRCWFGSEREVPMSGSFSAMSLGRALTDEQAMEMIQYFNIVHAAWGGDAEYFRLWGSLNLTMVAWIWRRMVLTQHSPKSTRMTAAQFADCATGLSADGQYLSWLIGRQYGDRDRSPAYARIKTLFQARFKIKAGQALQFPGPAWVVHTSGRR